ncbi:hypothetical protein Dshi_2769 [Dinoroseobacter shibae DFL 12 = DSM 16493]|jgi:5-formyltetrahydrofolate cyclo-ligase|uniref:5-formyltetrahydrofolate cyclo-ligase n=1 Tax=Dinoroseobacter shibae (strain DSM 16493 / NCIMB 14021 / DFL 12) TaxID=398580 RepID=A8LJ07_DINSH|nr:5-formyltetrahydrofolate cyclo-ligase [Dinoroseobacter shibae]ABV94502.1 hypothetical protein Dshi_2769 [Dinoroseobacter shibae DFL 12 = DSM 16493]URF45929.1 5-formyltetrahydrofolate cyclo-ligase [Dinoroseobacter shibae]URF50235.1 5-formyltetrahydrofolate cyclo-ligase [Dinoroseobacter shibae]
MTALALAKAEARKTGFARRKVAFDADRAAGFAGLAAATEVLCDLLAGRAGPVAGYMPIRTEISPLPAMTRLAAAREIGVPVIAAMGMPLDFHRWTPGAEMVAGPFGAQVPRAAQPMVPEVVIVPLVAFDATGGRLGYGGGFYDRTLAKLRSTGPVLALGLAYAAQQTDAPLPVEATDIPLDGVVTEAGALVFDGLRH